MWKGTKENVSFIFKAAATATFAFVPPSFAQSDDEVCKSLGDLGSTFMKARQKGIPLSDLVKVFPESSDNYTAEVARKLAIAAYEQPRYSTEENQLQVVSEFRDAIELACYKKAQSE